MDDHRRVFGENLRSARKQAGLTQEQLGFATGLHRTEVSLLENSSRDPRLWTIVRLARALEVPVTRLVEGVR